MTVRRFRPRTPVDPSTVPPPNPDADDSHRQSSDIRGITKRPAVCSGRYFGQFVVEVEYRQLPFEDLRNLFGRHVHAGYHTARFQPIESCTGISLQQRSLIFELWQPDRGVRTEEVLEALLIRPEVRPALYEEAIAFGDYWPNEQTKHPIVALGSEAFYNGQRHVACLSCQAMAGRLLQLFPAADAWHSDVTFLVAQRQPAFEIDPFLR